MTQLPQQGGLNVGVYIGGYVLVYVPKLSQELSVKFCVQVTTEVFWVFVVFQEKYPLS